MGIETDPPTKIPGITCKCGRPMFCVDIAKSGSELLYRCDRCGRRLWMVWDETRVQGPQSDVRGHGPEEAA